MARESGATLVRVWARGSLVLAIAFAGLAPGVVPSDRLAAATTPVPAQWITKQFTELLGRVPTQSEWSGWSSYYRANGCTSTTLVALTRGLAQSPAFASAYPTTSGLGTAARVSALVRAVDRRDPTTSDWQSFAVPYLAGTRTWDATIASTFNSDFASTALHQICSTVSPSAGFSYVAPLDVRSLVGVAPSRSQAVLQAALNDAAPGTTVVLQPGEVVRIGGTSNANQPLRIPDGVTLSTVGTPALSAYVRMGRLVLAGPGASVCASGMCSDIGIVSLGPGSSLRNVWVDGVGSSARNARVANVETHGSSASSPTSVIGDRITEPGPRGAGIRALGSSTETVPCTDERVSGNLITEYSSQRTLDDLNGEQASDGIEIDCEAATVNDNAIVDASGLSVVLRGVYNRGTDTVVAQHSTATNNTVISAGVSGRAAFAADPVGPCRALRGSVIVPCLDVTTLRSFVGASVAANTYWTSQQTSFDVALLVGGRTVWGDNSIVGRGASFTGNVVGAGGARVNLGVAIAGMLDATVRGNTGSFVLADTNPQLKWHKCPLARIAVDAADAPNLGTDLVPVVRDDIAGCVLSAPSALGPERIAVGAGGRSFIGGRSARAFVPWGVMYEGLADQVWTTNWDLFVDNLRDIKRLGANTVRLLLEFHSFVDAPSTGFPNGTPNVAALNRLADVIELARETGLYVDLTGLGIEVDDTGSWYDQLPEQARWSAQTVFWAAVSARLKGNTSVAWLDLMNEPQMYSPTGLQWCVGGVNGYCFVQALSLDPGSRTSLQIAQSWISLMTSAIRTTGGDVQHLISTGLLPYGYSGVKPADIANLEGFGMVHLYPRSDDPATPGNELLADIASVKSSKPATQPLVLEETGKLHCTDAEFELFTRAIRPAIGGFITDYDSSDETPAQLIADLLRLDPASPDYANAAFAITDALADLRSWIMLTALVNP